MQYIVITDQNTKIDETIDDLKKKRFPCRIDSASLEHWKEEQYYEKQYPEAIQKRRYVKLELDWLQHQTMRIESCIQTLSHEGTAHVSREALIYASSENGRSHLDFREFQMTSLEETGTESRQSKS